MKIIWSPNPIATVVELDEFDKKLLWHKVKIHRLEEMIGEAHLDLDPEFQEWRRTALKERCPVDFVADARKHLRYRFISGEEKINGKSFDEVVGEATDDCVSALSSHHDGDCVCVPCSCEKCHAEMLVGVDTLAGLGKHEASSIDGCFSRGETPTVPQLEATLVKLSTYDGSSAPEWGQPHIARWVEEHKRAHAWLVAYQAAHFSTEPVGLLRTLGDV